MVKEKIIQYSLVLILMLGMSFSIVYGALYAIRPDQKPHFIAWAIIGFMILCLMFGTSKRSFIVSILIILIGGGVFTIYLYKEGALITVMLRSSFFIKRNKELLAISLFTVILTYLFTLKYFKLLLPVAIGSSIYILYIIKEMPLPKFALEIFIGISLCYYFCDYYLKIKKASEIPIKTRSYIKSISLFMAVIFSVTCLSAYMLPLKFSFLHSVLDSNSNQDRAYRYSEYYPYTGRLGGALTPNETEVLGVVGKVPTYLRAGTKSIYTGYSWTSPQTEPEVFLTGKAKLIDTYEGLHGISLLTAEPISELFNEDALRITFKDIRTKSLFIPPKSMNLVVSRNTYSIYRENEDTLFLERPYGKGFIYVVQCYTPNYESKVFKEALRKSEPGLYREVKAKGMDPFEGEIDQFIKRASDIQSQYTQLPKSVTKRVRALANSITDDYKTTYDKVSAIERYLSESYTYTLTPATGSRNKDFVDQFLFEIKEGYCTYFASAMVVLTRCLGIPSRYVEGYKMPTNYDIETSTYTVTNKEAHAWVEVYFEGVGWVMFEPTASDQTSPVYDIEELDKDVIEGQDEIGGEMGYRPNEVNGTTKWPLGMVIGIVIISVVFIGIKQYKAYKIRGMNPNEATCYYYHLCLMELAKNQQGIEAGETEWTYAQRIDEAFSLDTLSFEEVTHIYLKAQYSLVPLTREDQEKMQQCYKKLKKLSFDGL